MIDSLIKTLKDCLNPLPYIEVSGALILLTSIEYVVYEPEVSKNEATEERPAGPACAALHLASGEVFEVPLTDVGDFEARLKADLNEAKALKAEQDKTQKAILDGQQAFVDAVNRAVNGGIVTPQQVANAQQLAQTGLRRKS